MEFPNLSTTPIICLDYETTGLKQWSRDFGVLGAAIATADRDWYFDVRTSPGLGQWLRDTLPGKEVVAHNAQFEYQTTRVLAIEPRSVKWRCTMVAACLIDEHLIKYDLDSVAAFHGVASNKRASRATMAAALGIADGPAVMARLAEVPPELLAAYGGGDARIAFDVDAAQRPLLEEQGLLRVHALEMRLLPVLADMTWYGVRVDLEAAHRAIPALDAKEAEHAAEIKSQTGCKEPSVFVNSPKQMREFFRPEQVNKWQWRLIDDTLVGPTKGGKGPSLAAEAMRNIRHPVAKSILALRKTIKLRDTFIRGHVIASADELGYVHTHFNQTRSDNDDGTITGRLSSVDPALQQITKRDKVAAALLRALFLPDDGQEWLSLDYNQIDFRMAAHLINEPAVIRSYQDNPKLDYHQVVSDMTGIPRNPEYAGAPNTKQLNLSLAFGAGAGKIAFMMGMPYEVGEWKDRMVYYPGPEAKAVFAQYHARLPGVSAFSKHAERVAKTRGFVKTLMGRRLRFDKGHHKAAGLLFQAYAADVNKLGLLAIDEVVRGTSSRLLLSVHDEADLSLHDRKLIPDIVDAFTSMNKPESALSLRVPIACSTEIGPNWASLAEV